MISSSSSRARFLLDGFVGPLLPADMLGRKGELAGVSPDVGAAETTRTVSLPHYLGQLYLSKTSTVAVQQQKCRPG